METILAQLELWLPEAQAPAVEDIKTLERILALAEDPEAIVPVPPKAPVVAAAAPDDPEDFEYFQLPQEQTLKQVSALVTVYGDPSQWSRLLEANRDTVSSPDTPLPSGTVLLVPRVQSTSASTN
jgi:nucleoid-associated protein YgaU